MSFIRTSEYLIITIVALLTMSPAFAVSPAQTSAKLSVFITGQNLTGGFNNTVTITVSNNISPTVYDVDVVLSAVSSSFPLVLYGDNHWHYDRISRGQSVTVTVQIFAPVSSIANSYQGLVSITYKQLGDVSYTTESHDVSFTVHGWIKLVVYGIQVTPTSAAPGGNVTVSGNLLNSGNLAAYDANVTVESTALAPGTSTSSYIGEVDPNIPRPFSLLVIFKKNLQEGNYSLLVRVTAIDTNNPSFPYHDEEVSVVQIRRPATTGTGQRQQEAGIMVSILEILRYLYNTFFGSLFGTVQAPLAYSQFNVAIALRTVSDALLQNSLRRFPS